MLVPVTPAYGSMWKYTSLGPTSDVVGHSGYISKLGIHTFMSTLTVMVKLDSQHRSLGNQSDVAE